MKTLRNTVYTLSLTLLFGCGIDNQKNMHSQDSIQAESIQATRKALLLSGYIRRQSKGLLLSDYMRKQTNRLMPDNIDELINMYLEAYIYHKDLYPLLKHITGYGTSESRYHKITDKITDKKTLEHATDIYKFYDNKWYKNEEKYCKSIGYHKALASSSHYDSNDFINVVKILMQQNSDDDEKLKDKQPDNFIANCKYIDKLKKIEKQKEVLNFIQGAVEAYVETHNSIMQAMEEYAILGKLYKINNYINGYLNTVLPTRFKKSARESLLTNPLEDLLNIERLSDLKQPNKYCNIADAQDVLDEIIFRSKKYNSHKHYFRLILSFDLKTDSGIIESQKKFLNECSQEFLTLQDEWEGLYNKYEHRKPYDKEKFAAAVNALQQDIALYIEIQDRLIDARKNFIDSIPEFIEKLKSIPQEWRDLYDYVVCENQPVFINSRLLNNKNKKKKKKKKEEKKKKKKEKKKEEEEEELRKAYNDTSFAILCANFLAASNSILQEDQEKAKRIQKRSDGPTRKDLLVGGYMIEQDPHLYIPDDIAKLINMYLTAYINDEDFNPLLQYIIGRCASRGSYQDTTDKKTLEYATEIYKFYNDQWRKHEAIYCTKVGYGNRLNKNNLKYKYDSYDFISAVYDFISVVKISMQKYRVDRQQQDFLLQNDTTYTYQDHIKYIPKALNFIQGAVEAYVETRNSIIQAIKKYNISDIFNDTSGIFDKHYTDIARAKSERFKNEIERILINPMTNLTKPTRWPQGRSAYLKIHENYIKPSDLIKIIDASRRSEDYKLIRTLPSKKTEIAAEIVAEIRSQENSHIKFIEELKNNAQELLLSNASESTEKDKRNFLDAVDGLQKDIELYIAIKRVISKCMHSFFNNTLVIDFIKEIKSIPQEWRDLYDHVAWERQWHTSDDTSSNEQNTCPNIFCAKLLAAYDSIQNQ